jgi:signal transduction histidine kinase
VAAPLVAVVYLVLWIIAESGHTSSFFGIGMAVDVVAYYGVFAVAIATAAWLPYVSLGIVVLVPFLQLAGLYLPPESTTWPSYEAIAIVGFFVGTQRVRVRTWVVVTAGTVSTGFAALDMVAPHQLFGWFRFGWVAWIGMGARSVDSLYLLSTFAFVLLLALGLLAYFVAWGAGLAVSLAGTHQTSLWMRTQLRRTGDDLHREQERAAIARDVHDTLAHSLAVVVAQAEGGLAAAASDDGASDRALAVIAEVGREALIDCRSLVERIQVETGAERPQPTTTDVPALIQRMRGLGMAVRYQVLGEESPLSPSRQLTFYRIVQESLTNALKHGGPDAEVTVTADWRGSGLALLIASRGTEVLNDTGGGAGIAGMRERARLAGGWLSAGPGDDEDFVVTAYLPFEQHADRAKETVDA